MRCGLISPQRKCGDRRDVVTPPGMSRLSAYPSRLSSKNASSIFSAPRSPGCQSVSISGAGGAPIAGKGKLSGICSGPVICTGGADRSHGSPAFRHAFQNGEKTLKWLPLFLFIICQGSKKRLPTCPSPCRLFSFSQDLNCVSRSIVSFSYCRFQNTSAASVSSTSARIASSPLPFR